jgi:hypothetical protein
MTIRIISQEEKAEYAKHPAKQYIQVPLKDMRTDGMMPEDYAWLLAWRERVAAWVEGPEADAQARIVNAAAEVYNRERDKLRKMCEAATREGDHRMPSRRKPEEK